MSITNDQRLTLEKYIYYRKTGDVESCLSLMSQDIVYISERDGKFYGHEQMKAFIKKNPFQGEWGAPYWSTIDDSIRIDGKIIVYLIPVKVKILVQFDNKQKIKRVYIGRQ